MDPLIQFALLLCIFGVAQYGVEALPMPQSSKQWVRAAMAIAFAAYLLRLARVI